MNEIQTNADVLIAEGIHNINAKITYEDKTKNVLVITTTTNAEVIRLDGEGKLFWNGQEVTTDDNFKDCILTMIAIMSGRP